MILSMSLFTFGIHVSVVPVDPEKPLLKSSVAPATARMLINTWSSGVGQDALFVYAFILH